MKLRDLKINQVKFWYQTYLGETAELDTDGNETGETTENYSNPVPAKARISPNAGNAYESPFGADVSYDRSIATIQNLPIDEHSRLFIDVIPELKEDGSTETKPDYICVKAANDLHENLWAIRKVQQ